MVVDASVWVSSVLALDANHLASTRWFVEQTKNAVHLVVPIHFVSEVAGSVMRRTGAHEVGLRVIEEITSHPFVEIVPIDTSLGIRSAELAVELSLHGSDAIYVALAERVGVSLITWDLQQLRRSAAVVDARQPLFQSDSSTCRVR